MSSLKARRAPRISGIQCVPSRCVSVNLESGSLKKILFDGCSLLAFTQRNEMLSDFGRLFRFLFISYGYILRTMLDCVVFG